MKPDLMFLDVQMPEWTVSSDGGNRRENAPVVIFVTALTTFALQRF
jgi:DNA-binding LytR/AlgR family response regulator